MANPSHKAGSGTLPEGLGMGKQPLRQCIEAAPFLGRQHLIEALLVAERDRHDAAVHGAAAGAQPERGAAAGRGAATPRHCVTVSPNGSAYGSCSDSDTIWARTDSR